MLSTSSSSCLVSCKLPVSVQHGENRAQAKDNARGIWKKEAASRGGKESEGDKEAEEVEEHKRRNEFLNGVVL